VRTVVALLIAKKAKTERLRLRNGLGLERTLAATVSLVEL
jgi:hypothetical protein